MDRDSCDTHAEDFTPLTAAEEKELVHIMQKRKIPEMSPDLAQRIIDAAEKEHVHQPYAETSPSQIARPTKTHSRNQSLGLADTFSAWLKSLFGDARNPTYKNAMTMAAAVVIFMAVVIMFVTVSPPPPNAGTGLDPSMIDAETAALLIETDLFLDV